MDMTDQSLKGSWLKNLYNILKGEEKMEPVISPMFFYFLSIADAFKMSLVALIIIFSISLFIISIYFVVESATGYDTEKTKEQYKRLPKKTTILGYLFIILLAILIPSKNTLIEMEVARNITYDRIDKVISVGKDIKNDLKVDIIDIIKAINKKNKK